MASRHFEGREPLVPLRHIVAGPPPPHEVLVTPWWPVEGPSCPTDLRGYLVVEVLVGGVEGPIRHDVPEELVRLGPANDARLGEEQEVNSGLIVELEDPHDRQPLIEGLVVHT